MGAADVWFVSVLPQVAQSFSTRSKSNLLNLFNKKLSHKHEEKLPSLIFEKLSPVLGFTAFKRQILQSGFPRSGRAPQPTLTESLTGHDITCPTWLFALPN